MRILILGAAGMLGHKLVQLYASRYETWGTLRSAERTLPGIQVGDPGRLITGVDAFRFDSVVNAFARCRPDVVINCIGIIRQLPTANDPLISIEINSLLPHRLALLCRTTGARLIHISTDCVFSGRTGMYTEASKPDPEDLYGRTKLLGEVSAAPNCLTIRTSIIGREISSASGLVEWFLSRRGESVRGYKYALYSGLTTNAMAQVIADVIEHHVDLSGLYQVSSDPIGKYDLLHLLNEAYQTETAIEAETQFRLDRTLDSTRFRKATGFRPKTWAQMIGDMAADPTPYAGGGARSTAMAR